MIHIRTVSARQREIRAYFAETTARAEIDRPSPVFAGRDGAIGPILRDADRLSRAQGPKANLSTVLYGAPGSGKSELLAQLRARLTAMHPSGSPIAVVSGGVALLTDAGALGAAVYEALGSESRKNLRDRFGWNIAGLSLGPVGLSLDRKDDRPPGVEENRLRKVAGDINESARNPTVVLMIDEAQGELREAAGASDNFVLAMHKGEAHLKLLPIYAGLGDTPRLLADCHVSRLGYGKDHLMRHLEAHDVAAMAEEALAALAGRSPHRWVDAIVDHTQGWPMHLTNVLSAVAERATPEWTIDDNGFLDAMRGADRTATRG